MAEKKTRARDAGSGKLVTKAAAKADPKGTVTEDASKDGLAKRVALLEAVIEAAGGPLAVLFRRRKRGLSD